MNVPMRLFVAIAFLCACRFVWATEQDEQQGYYDALNITQMTTTLVTPTDQPTEPTENHGPQKQVLTNNIQTQKKNEQENTGSLLLFSPNVHFSIDDPVNVIRQRLALKHAKLAVQERNAQVTVQIAENREQLKRIG